MTFASCAKFYVVPQCKEINVHLNVIINSAAIDNADYSGIIYEWDEEKYGKIVDKNVDTVTYVVFDSTFKENEIINSALGEEKFLDIKYPYKYDLVIRNKTRDTKYYVQEKKYVSESEYSDITYGFNYAKPQKSIKQCEKQYSAYNENVFSVIDENDLTIDKMEKNQNGTYTYNCYVNSVMVPVSFTYIVQLIIYNDDPQIPMIVDKCDYIGISGLAKNVDLITAKTGKEFGVVETTDIKPFQHNENYYICCAKICTYGMPNMENDSSWIENNYCELGIELVLVNGNKKRGKVSVYNKILNNPNGGVITLTLNNSAIYDSDDYIDEGITPDVNEWEETVIDVPF